MKTYTLDLVTGVEEDKILSNEDNLRKVVDFFKSNKETLMLILNALNEEDATVLIARAETEKEFIFHRGKMKGREDLYTSLEKYETELAKREEEAKKKSTEEPIPASLPTADEELTLEKS